MGYTAATDMIAHADMETSLIWHLTANHYPALPTILVGPCITAIDCAVADEWDAEVELPEGLHFRGMATAPAWQIVETCHLQAFVESCLAHEAW